MGVFHFLDPSTSRILTPTTINLPQTHCQSASQVLSFNYHHQSQFHHDVCLQDVCHPPSHSRTHHRHHRRRSQRDCRPPERHNRPCKLLCQSHEAQHSPAESECRSSPLIPTPLIPQTPAPLTHS